MSYEGMKRRLNYYGGAPQQDRMIRDKLWSMLSATKYSYQAAKFTKYPGMDKQTVGLFNPVTQNMDYDTKLLSVPFDAQYSVGDVFRWDNTGTYWICYARDLTELAYFRGQCRRCDYKVQWVDGDREVQETFISVVGPSNPDFTSTNTTFGSADLPNANLVVLATANQQNRAYFNQYQKFLLKSFTYKVDQIDDISMPGVLQMNCSRYYTNLVEDDVETNIMNTWNVQPVIPEYPTEYGIEGPLVIKPRFRVEFKAIVAGGKWIIVENEGVRPHDQIPAKFQETDDIYAQQIHVYWDSMMSGAFTIGYQMPNGTLYQKHVQVESLM